MTRVKICGLRRLEDALVAANAGADYLGLVLVPERRRRVELDLARSIVAGLRDALDSPPQVVGLFADQSLAEVNRAIAYCGLDLAQLCGQEAHESLDYCRQVRARVIKVLHVAASPHGATPEDDTPDRLTERLQTYRQAGHLVTLDRLVTGAPGGTGQRFDWNVAARLAQGGHQFLLAGGLDPDNVAGAITQVQPWGVDVSSGVETGGHQDPEKIRAFVRNARRVSVPE